MTAGKIGSTGYEQIILRQPHKKFNQFQKEWGYQQTAYAKLSPA